MRCRDVRHRAAIGCVDARGVLNGGLTNGTVSAQNPFVSCGGARASVEIESRSVLAERAGGVFEGFFSFFRSFRRFTTFTSPRSLLCQPKLQASYFAAADLRHRRRTHHPHLPFPTCGLSSACKRAHRGVAAGASGWPTRGQKGFSRGCVACRRRRTLFSEVVKKRAVYSCLRLRRLHKC